MKLLEELKNINEIIAVSQFGSYGSKFWIENKSDIDLIAIIYSDIVYINILNLEERLTKLFKRYYNYDNIHLTLLRFNEFKSKYASMAIDSNNVFIVDKESWCYFNYYVSKESEQKK